MSYVNIDVDKREKERFDEINELWCQMTNCEECGEIVTS
jgi:hypothetical protein